MRERLIVAICATALIVAMVFIVDQTRDVPLYADHVWDNLPAGAEQVWASGHKRAYRLNGCVWFDYWYYRGWWTPVVDKDGKPAADC